METDNKPAKQGDNRPWLYNKGQFKKGQSGNPSGRPKGSISMKEYVKKKLATMNEEEREVFLEGVDKKIIWSMAEGNPDTKIDAKISEKSEFTTEQINAARKILGLTPIESTD